ncbi:MAG: DASS family sodium-coupled anion symporter [Dehalobacterium sp.]
MSSEEKNSKGFWWRLAIVVGIPLIMWFLEPPAGLSVEAWHILAVYIGAILGVIFKPYPEPVILLVACTTLGVVFLDYKMALSGFSNRTAWLVFSAYLIGQAFVDTNLGKRISYHLLKKFGRSSLSVGYVMAFSDLLVSPATPSNTARTGGIVYPIFRSLAVALGSNPGPTSRKIGSYLTLLSFQNSMTTHAMFVTAGASNLVVMEFASSILDIHVSWIGWFIAILVPGLAAFLFMPWLVYKVYPPEIKAIPESKKIAEDGLKELGTMTRQEKFLALFFVLAIIGWATAEISGINSTVVALAFVCLCLLFRVVPWKSLATNDKAWTTYIWYAGILGIAALLADAGFFLWLADIMGKNLPLAGMNPILIYLILLVISILPRYLFASTAAFAASFYPVLFSMAIAAEVNLMVVGLLLMYSLSYGSAVTPYSNAVGPLLFGTDYVEDSKMIWIVGALLAVVGIVCLMVLGLPYWKILGLW